MAYSHARRRVPIPLLEIGTCPWNGYSSQLGLASIQVSVPVWGQCELTRYNCNDRDIYNCNDRDIPATGIVNMWTSHCRKPQNQLDWATKSIRWGVCGDDSSTIVYVVRKASCDNQQQHNYVECDSSVLITMVLTLCYRKPAVTTSLARPLRGISVECAGVTARPARLCPELSTK